MQIEYRLGESAFTPEEFVALAQRVWRRNYDLNQAADAVQRTINVDPDYRRRGIGRELMHRALAIAPGGRLFLGAQSGNESFFEASGFVRGPVGFVGRRPHIDSGAAV